MCNMHEVDSSVLQTILISEPSLVLTSLLLRIGGAAALDSKVSSSSRGDLPPGLVLGSNDDQSCLCSRKIPLMTLFTIRSSSSFARRS